MDDSKKIKLDIYIGDVPLTVFSTPAKREDVRRLEAELNSLFKNWRRQFPHKEERELLAMMAYQYASYYQDITGRYKEVARAAHDCDIALDNLDAALDGCLDD